MMGVIILRRLEMKLITRKYDTNISPHKYDEKIHPRMCGYVICRDEVLDDPNCPKVYKAILEANIKFDVCYIRDGIIKIGFTEF